LIDSPQSLPNKLWDGVLGQHWDLVRNGEGDAAVIKTMRFNLQENYLLKTIRVQFVVIDGTYREESYREIIFGNSVATRAAMMGVHPDDVQSSN
jgi:hypothetical protein